MSRRSTYVVQYNNGTHPPMAKGTADDGGAATGTAGQETKVQDKQASGKEEQLVIRAPVHCDGCARKLRRSLQLLEGVGEVTVDSRTNTVVVRGRGAVESATEVLQVVERKTGEKAVLVSPTPEKLPPAKGGQGNKKGDANKDMMASELPELDMKMVTVMKMNLHCDACTEEIKRRILKITGVEDAMPHLKSSQVMVKGKVEPATLVGFIHKCTGRKAAIIRAEPVDLLESPNSPVPPMVIAPPVEAESKKDGPPENPAGEKKNGGRQNGKKKEEPNEENKGGGGGGGDNVDESPETEKPSDDGHGAAEEHGSHAGDEAPNHGGGFVLENHTKDDRLFTVPMAAGVVTVAPEMALSNRSYFYPAYPSYAQYCYPYQQYQLYPQPYPAYACSPASMYGYPVNYPPEAFSEENPNACTIV